MCWQIIPVSFCELEAVAVDGQGLKGPVNAIMHCPTNSFSSHTQDDSQFLWIQVTMTGPLATNNGFALSKLKRMSFNLS